MSDSSTGSEELPKAPPKSKSNNKLASAKGDGKTAKQSKRNVTADSPEKANGNADKKFGRKATKNNVDKAKDGDKRPTKPKKAKSTVGRKKSKKAVTAPISASAVVSPISAKDEPKRKPAKAPKQEDEAAAALESTGLVRAVKNSDKDSVAKILNNPEALKHLNATFGSHSSTVLQLAVRRGSLEVVQLLVAKGADLNKQDSDGKTSLHWAVSQKDDTITPVVQFLVAQASAKLNLTDAKKRTILHLAAALAHPKVVAALLATPELIKACLNARDQAGSTSLATAIKHDRNENFKLLLKVDGIDVNVADMKGRTPLHYACMKGQKLTVEALLGKNSDCKKFDFEKNTALHFACTQHTFEVVNALIKAGADVNSENLSKQSPLHFATEAEDETICHILIQAGANVAIRYDAELFHKRLHKHLAIAKPTNMDDSVSNSDTTIDESDIGLAKSNAATPVLEELRLKYDKNGFIVDSKSTEAVTFDPKVAKKRAKKQELRVRKWLKMLRRWNEALKKDEKRVRGRIYKGIPDMLRGQAWRSMFNSEFLKKQHATQYQSLLAKEASPKILHQIDVDINRSARNHAQFHERFGIGQICLFNILKAYSILDKQVGYCQSMSDVTAILLMFVEEEECFHILVELCQNPKFKMGPRYEDGFPGLKASFYVWEQLLQEDMPELWKKIQEAGIDTSFYTMRWFMKLFSDVLPFDQTLRLWDILFFEGFDILYTIMIVFVRSHYSSLMACSNEELLMKLQRLDSLPKNMTIERFVKEVKHIHVPSSLIHELEVEFKDVEKKQKDMIDKREKEYHAKKAATAALNMAKTAKKGMDNAASVTHGPKSNLNAGTESSSFEESSDKSSEDSEITTPRPGQAPAKKAANKPVAKKAAVSRAKDSSESGSGSDSDIEPSSDEKPAKKTAEKTRASESSSFDESEE